MIYLAFDLDGTLFDVSDIAVDGFTQGIEQFIAHSSNKNIPKPDYDAIRKVLGIPIDEIFRRLFPDLQSHDQQMLNDYCTDALVELIKKGGGSVFPGVRETIESLYSTSKYTLYIASNGRPEYIIAALKQFGLLNFFSEPFIFLDGRIKSKSDIITEYKKITSEQDTLIMIGDRKNDLDAAKVNGIPFIGCSFGHAGSSEIGEASYIAQSFNEVPSLIKQITGKFYHEKSNLINTNCS